MKKTHLFVLLLILGIGFGFTPKETVSDKVVAFCKQNMDKKVDRGECWDLARFALDFAGADWQSPHDFGTKVDYKTEKLKPGDILQMENITFSWTEGDNTFTAMFPHHTAIVYEVKENGNIVMAHQNFNNVRKVSTLEISLSSIQKGDLQAYRPKAKA